MKRTPIILTAEQRRELEQFTNSGVHSVRLVNRAKIILALDTSEERKALKQKDIADRLGISRNTVNQARRDFIRTESLTLFLQRKKRETPPAAPKITGDIEAKIIALACSEPPKGAARWTLELLADKSVELKYVGSISAMSVHRHLKKLNLSLT